jgi:hypothetical protein
MKFHYDLRIIYRTWQQWVMSDRKEMPDIRQVAVQDEDGTNDVWMMDYVIRYLLDSGAEQSKDLTDL